MAPTLAGFNFHGNPLLYAIAAVSLFAPHEVGEKFEKDVDTPEERE